MALLSTRFQVLIATAIHWLLLLTVIAAPENVATAWTGDNNAVAEDYDANVERMARIIGGRRAPDTTRRAVCHLVLRPTGEDFAAKFSGFLVRFPRERKLAVLTVAHTIVKNTTIAAQKTPYTAEQAKRWFGQHINMGHSRHYNVFRRGTLDITCGSELPEAHTVSIDAERYRTHIRLNKNFHDTAEQSEPVDDISVIIFAGEALKEAEKFMTDGKWAFWENVFPPGPVQTNQKCIMTGFGHYDHTKVASAYPREGVGRVMSARDCGYEANKYDYRRPFGEPYPFLCLRAISGDPKDAQLLAAFGDSGGPVHCMLAQPPRYFLVGIIHSGIHWIETDDVEHTVVVPLYERELWNEFLGPALTT